MTPSSSLSVAVNTRALTGRVGLADRVTFRQASALDLPFPATSFDAVCMLHVGMNIEHKDTLCAELARVLRPGGACGIYDVMRSGDGDLTYPVPWAGSPAIGRLRQWKHALRRVR